MGHIFLSTLKTKRFKMTLVVRDQKEMFYENILRKILVWLSLWILKCQQLGRHDAILVSRSVHVDLLYLNSIHRYRICKDRPCYNADTEILQIVLKYNSQSGKFSWNIGSKQKNLMVSIVYK